MMTFIIAANITAEEKLKITFANNLPINTADTKAKIKDFIVFMRSARSASNISEGVLFDVKVALNDVMKFGSYAFILILLHRRIARYCAKLIFFPVISFKSSVRPRPRYLSVYSSIVNPTRFRLCFR